MMVTMASKVKIGRAVGAAGLAATLVYAGMWVGGTTERIKKLERDYANMQEEGDIAERIKNLERDYANMQEEGDIAERIKNLERAHSQSVQYHAVQYHAQDCSQSDFARRLARRGEKSVWCLP